MFLDAGEVLNTNNTSYNAAICGLLLNFFPGNVIKKYSKKKEDYFHSRFDEQYKVKS